MILPDINLLVYAYNTGAPHHAAAKAWWEELMNGTTPVALPWLVLSGFIRLTTHPRILTEPMDVSVATSHIQAWLDRSPAIVISPGRRFQALFLGYLDQLGTGGNLTTDAQLAALAVEHQAEIHSNDTDFARFAGLRWHNPLSAGLKR